MILNEKGSHWGFEQESDMIGTVFSRITLFFFNHCVKSRLWWGKVGGQDTNREASAVIQTKRTGGLSQNASSVVMRSGWIMDVF